MSAKRPTRRGAYTLIELLVAIAIILALAALAAAFLPRVNGNQNLIRSMDQLEQWLLTAKMRAKRDGLATGLRFNPDPNNPGMFSEVQYIQQPEPLSGGWISATATPNSKPYGSGTPPLYLNGGILLSASNGTVTFYNVDFYNGQSTVPTDWLVQPGDFLEVQGGSLYYIGAVVPPPSGQPATQLALGPTNPSPPPYTHPNAYEQSLTIAAPTTNYRIFRQPRLLTGEAPLELPHNFVVDGSNSALFNIPLRSVPGAPYGGYEEILFAPSGAVTGHGASNGKIYVAVHEVGQTDLNLYGIIAVQTRTGFIGAYNVAPGNDPLLYAEEGRNSGL
jgi:prepilin-type N-terminal cleavage/methylation domain-containing protein